MVWISDKQILTMSMIEVIVNKFGADRWFVQAELPGITQHSMDALVNKGYLEINDNDFVGSKVLYYRRIKQLEN